MKRFLLILSAMVVVALYASFLTPRLKFGGDAVDYVRLADSLAHGEGYRVDGQFNSKWPPITPLLHSLVIRSTGFNVAGFKFVSMLCALSGLWLSYLLLKRYYDERLGLHAVLLAAVSFPVIYWVVDVSSEAPYLLFSLAGLLLTEEALKRQRWVWAVVAGLAFGLAVLSRTVGLALLIGLVLAVIFKLVRGRRAEAGKLCLVMLVAMVLAGSWLGYSRSQSGKTSISTYGSYAFRADIYDKESKGGFTTLLRRAKENAIGYLFVFAVPDASLRLKNTNRLTPLGVVSAFTMILSLAGWMWHLWKSPTTIEWCLLVYCGALLAVAWYDIRYLVPIMPLMFFYFATAVNSIGGWVAGKLGRPGWGPVATTTALCLLIAGNVVISVIGPQAKRLRAKEYSGVAREQYEAAMWIKSHQPEATVVSRSPGMIWFWTRLSVLSFPWFDTPENVWRFLEEKNVGYVILDPDEFSGVTGKYLKPALDAHPDRVVEAARFGATRVVQIRPPAMPLTQ